MLVIGIYVWLKEILSSWKEKYDAGKKSKCLEPLIPSPPQLCSHVCQLHCLQMLMRILPESILLVIHIISLSTAKTSNKACDMGFFQSLPLQNSIQGVNLWQRMKILGTCHNVNERYKNIFPLYFFIFVIFIENPWRVPYVSTSAKNYISFIFINFCYIYSKSLARAICVNKR